MRIFEDKFDLTRITNSRNEGAVILFIFLDIILFTIIYVNINKYEYRVVSCLTIILCIMFIATIVFIAISSLRKKSRTSVVSFDIENDVLIIKSDNKYYAKFNLLLNFTTSFGVAMTREKFTSAITKIETINIYGGATNFVIAAPTSRTNPQQQTRAIDYDIYLSNIERFNELRDILDKYTIADEPPAPVPAPAMEDIWKDDSNDNL